MGGDGSTRKYTPDGTNKWKAPYLDRPDSITWDGSSYVRHLPHKLTVRFDAGGLHRYTVTRLGHTTEFQYNPDGSLFRIGLPPLINSQPAHFYTFGYTNGKLSSVTAPVGTQSRVTSVAINGSRQLTSVTDPDTRQVLFGYDAGFAHRIVSRTNKRGTATTFAYDAGHRLKESTLALGGSSIVTRFRSLESRGVAGSGVLPAAPDTAQAYALLDGPRTDVGDSTRLWLDRFGAPRMVKNALGDSTVLTRGNATFPALVTQMRAPNSLITQATYDGHGNIHTSTVVSPYGGGNAVTSYVWNQTWDFVQQVTLPEGEVTVMAYDANNGNRLWQEDSRGLPSRVTFTYNSLGLLETITPPGSLPQQLFYSTIGNLEEARTPLGPSTTYRTDTLGRVVSIRSPIDGTLTKKDTILYDVMDRETWRETIGPEVTYVREFGSNPEKEIVPSATLRVEQTYDHEGNRLSLTQRSIPDNNAVGAVTTTWVYDLAHRVVKEIPPGGGADSSVYDPAGNVVKTITRRSDTLTTTYDPLNRVTQRIVPSVLYPGWTQVFELQTWRFPRWGPDAQGGLTVANTAGVNLTIPGDTVLFSYDVMGNIRSAKNRDARVMRGYAPNGSLIADTLQIRTYVGNDFTQHRYVLTHSYDLNGRRTATHYPANLTPRPQGLAYTDSVRYAYHSATGALETVVGLFGESYTHSYDYRGRLTQLAYPANVIETYQYDDDDRLTDRHNARTGQVLQDDALQYDVGGRITRVDAANGAEIIESAYSGLSALVYSQSWRASSPQVQPLEEHTLDALGNGYRTRRVTLSTAVIPEASWTTHTYGAGTGRLHSYGVSANDPANPLDEETELVHDIGGNKIQSRRYRFQENNSTLYDRAAYYYDAAGKLRLVDRRTCVVPVNASQCDYNIQPEYVERGAFEEMRYDALGRRVLVRTRTDQACTQRCQNTTQRFVWDGDRILLEISAHGATQALAVDIERDTGHVVSHNQPHMSYGRVAYIYGTGLDHPLGLVRMNYADSLPEPFLIVPHANWRGAYELGTTRTGALAECVTIMAPSQVITDPPVPTQYCVAIDWPSQYEWATHKSRSRGVLGPKSWMGSLIEGKRDLSGQKYMRNRYYDSDAGRFTQEDPIGLAGGSTSMGLPMGILSTSRIRLD